MQGMRIAWNETELREGFELCTQVGGSGVAPLQLGAPRHRGHQVVEHGLLAAASSTQSLGLLPPLLPAGGCLCFRRLTHAHREGGLAVLDWKLAGWLAEEGVP